MHLTGFVIFFIDGLLKWEKHWPWAEIKCLISGLISYAERMLWSISIHIIMPGRSTAFHVLLVTRKHVWYYKIKHARGFQNFIRQHIVRVLHKFSDCWILHSIYINILCLCMALFKLINNFNGVRGVFRKDSFNLPECTAAAVKHNLKNFW